MCSYFCLQPSMLQYLWYLRKSILLLWLQSRKMWLSQWATLTDAIAHLKFCFKNYFQFEYNVKLTEENWLLHTRYCLWNCLHLYSLYSSDRHCIMLIFESTSFPCILVLWYVLCFSVIYYPVVFYRDKRCVIYL